jgi:hypothetical protein
MAIEPGPKFPDGGSVTVCSACGRLVWDGDPAKRPDWMCDGTPPQAD